MNGAGVGTPYFLTDLLRGSARVRIGFECLEQVCKLAKAGFSRGPGEGDDELMLQLLLIDVHSRQALEQLRDVRPVQREDVPEWLQHLVTEIESSVEAVLASLEQAITVRHPDYADKLVLQCQWLSAGAESLASYLKAAAKTQ